MPIAFSAGDAAYWGLAVFLVLLGIGSAFALLQLGRLFDRISSFVGGTERDLLPVVVKTGGTVDRVNYQLDKLDTVTDSAVGMADSADTAVRAVSTAISKPVEKVSGVAAGISHGVASFRRKRDFGAARREASAAARQREADLHEDLRGAGPTPPAAAKPEPTPWPGTTPKPDPWPKPDPVAKPAPAPIPPEEQVPLPPPATAPVVPPPGGPGSAVPGAPGAGGPVTGTPDPEAPGAPGRPGSPPAA